MAEVSGPVIAIALVLCAVFVPTAFMAGISGQFFRQFALTIAASTIISAFNSLTLSPALCAILFKGHGGARRGTRGPRRTAMSKKEALPRWGVVLIAAAAGLLHAHAVRRSPPGSRNCPAGTAKHAADRSLRARRRLWGVRLALRWRRERRPGGSWPALVNRALGGFFAAFNWVFDRVIDAYGRSVAVVPEDLRHRLAGLRRLDGPDLPGLPGRAGRIHPRSGQGLSGRQRPVARRRQPGPHRQDRPADERDRPRRRRRSRASGTRSTCPAIPRCWAPTSATWAACS